MMKAVGSKWVLLFFLLMIISGCNPALNQKPKVDINAVISPVNSLDYNKLGGLSKINNPQQKDFKKFTLSVNIINDENLAYKNIKVPEIRQFKEVINSLKGSKTQVTRYWFGEYSGGGNSDYKVEIIFFARGLQAKDIKSAFRDMAIYVETETEKKEFNEEVFIISDNLIQKKRS